MGDVPLFRFTYRFYGRKVGAIGVMSEHTVTVVAESDDAAFVKLYDTHEHVFGCRLIREELADGD